MLASTIEALRVGDYARVLAELLESWRQVRATKLADAIGTVSGAVSSHRAPITGASQRDLHANWLRVASQEDPADVDRLLAAIGHGSLGQVEERVSWFAARAADPRVAEGLEALVASPPGPAFAKSSAAGVWRAVFATLAAMADPRTRTIHERLAWLADDRAPSPFDATNRRATMVRAIANVAKGIAPAPALTDPQLAQLDELRALVGEAKPKDPGAELLDAIYERPHVFDGRAVYADWLVAKTDPRGEFIALQLARASATIEPPAERHGADEPALSTRERTLLRTHGKAWLGALGTMLDNVVWERGFPAQAFLAPDVPVATLAAQREAATLHHLHVERRADADVGRRLALMPALLAASGLSWDAFSGLVAAGGGNLRTVAIDDDAPLPEDPAFLDSDWRLQRLDLRSGSATRGAPPDADVRSFMRTRLVRCLDTLVVGFNARRDQAYLEGFAASSIRRMLLDSWSRTLELAVERAEDGALITRVVVHHHKYDRAEIAASLRACAQTWPRELFERTVIEIDPRYPEPEREAILAAANALME